MVIITNGHPDIQRGKIQATAAAATVSDHIIIGGDEVAAGRQEKPHPSIFHRACRLAECQPHEVVLAVWFRRLCRAQCCLMRTLVRCN